MEFRNLNRAFVFNKAIRSYNKTYGHNLKASEVFILLSLNYGNDSILKIASYLKRFNRTTPTDMVSDALRLLMQRSLAEQQQKKYVLTLEGRNALNALEKRCRETRYDK